MNSETITDHGTRAGRRHGRSRACSSYHRRIGACRSLDAVVGHAVPIYASPVWHHDRRPLAH